jgi:DMSO/TMAO reductase YedYZ molybdopterin-dependent catalytic subunit
MKMTRRAWMTAVGGSGVAAAAGIAARTGLVPPDYRGVFGAGHALTYGAQRLLTARQPLAREFTRAQISAVAPVNGPAPESDDYFRLIDDNFAQWRLTIDGLVARPLSLSLDDLRRMPSSSHITMHTCEEGWSFIAEWTGVELSHVLRLAGIRDQARYVVFYPFDQWWDSLDMADALHPQTLLSYQMNGDMLPADHGAPLRLRVARQLGYKSIKYLSRITVVESLASIGKGLGSASAEDGYSWYAGI